MRLRRASSLLLLLAAGLAAGCGTAATSASHPAASAGTATVADPGVKPAQLAAADAKTILADFVPPPGAVRLATRPALPSGSPVMGVTSTAVADATGYWRATGQATALLAWEKAHISRSFSRQDVIIGPPSWNTVYSLPPVPGLLSTREMNVQLYDAGNGTTVIMADAMVGWEPARPASEAIPASVTAVTIAGSGLAPQPGPGPVTITSATVVRRLAALVNGLPLSTVAMDVPCPSGSGFTLTFRTTAGGPPAAVASGPGACGQVTLELGGQDEPPLLPPDAGAYRAALLRIAGLHWNLG